MGIYLSATPNSESTSISSMLWFPVADNWIRTFLQQDQNKKCLNKIGFCHKMIGVNKQCFVNKLQTDCSLFWLNPT